MNFMLQHAEVRPLYSLDTGPRDHTGAQGTQSGHIRTVCTQPGRIRTGTAGTRHISDRSHRADTGTVQCRGHKCDSVTPLGHSYMADTPETKKEKQYMTPQSS